VPRREALVAAAILRDATGKLLLTGNDWRGDGALRWILPGGLVEPGETVLEAVGREVYEETGLRVAGAGPLAYAVHVEDARMDQRTLALVFEVRWTGEVAPRDPDGFVVAARFFDADRLGDLLPSIPAMRDPLLEYLGGAPPGCVWCYTGWDAKQAVRV
jgi:8-oxo-dGTP diphosphatase